MRLVRAYIGLGANVGDARATLTDAVAALAALPGVRLRGVSRLYRTKPVGLTDQADFLNAAVALDVPAGPDPATGAIALLVALKNLERAFGRRRGKRWGPRELDLDLLVFGRHQLSLERPPEGAPLSASIDPGAANRLLEVPHPSMRDRLFVLAPLADLASHLVPTGWHETVGTVRRRRVEAEGKDAVIPVGSWNDAERAWIGPTGQPIQIRQPRLEEAEEAARAHTAAADAAYRDYAPEDPKADAIGRRTGLWRELLSNAKGQSFVAVDAGRIVGVLHIGDFRDDPTLGAVHILYVLPEWWGSGAGQLLMDRAHAELAKSFDEAQLTVLTANARARRFYERNGWRHMETLVEPHFGGQPTEVSRYERSLR